MTVGESIEFTDWGERRVVPPGAWADRPSLLKARAVAAEHARVTALPPSRNPDAPLVDVGLLRSLAERSAIGLIEVDRDRRVVASSGYPRPTPTGKGPERLEDHLGLLDAIGRRAVHDAVSRVLATGAQAVIDLPRDLGARPGARGCSLTVAAVRSAQGEVRGAVLCVVQVARADWGSATFVADSAFDDLTGCLDRTSILRHLASVIEAGVADVGVGASAALGGTGAIVVDLDSIRSVTERMGQRASDHVLSVLADRLRSALRSQDVVGRLGDDVFLVVCPALSGEHVGLAIANRVADRLAGPLHVGDEFFLPCASIGLALSSRSLTGADDLVARAASALSESKRNGAGAPVLARVGSAV